MLCNRQVGDLLQHAGEFARHNAHVVFVYPGPARRLKSRAREFSEGKTLPRHFDMVVDPDYSFTNAYGLRWDARRETAYPSTFVIDTNGTVRFAKISKTHGGRVPAREVVAALKKLK